MYQFINSKVIKRRHCFLIDRKVARQNGGLWSRWDIVSAVGQFYCCTSCNNKTFRKKHDASLSYGEQVPTKAHIDHTFNMSIMIYLILSNMQNIGCRILHQNFHAEFCTKIVIPGHFNNKLCMSWIDHNVVELRLNSMGWLWHCPEAPTTFQGNSSSVLK